MNPYYYKSKYPYYKKEIGWIERNCIVFIEDAEINNILNEISFADYDNEVERYMNTGYHEIMESELISLIFHKAFKRELRSFRYGTVLNDLDKELCTYFEMYPTRVANRMGYSVILITFWKKYYKSPMEVIINMEMNMKAQEYM